VSRIFGPVRQLGIVVNDLQATMKFYAEELGIGPFFYWQQIPLMEFVYNGEPSGAKGAVALAYSGKLQLELICPHDDLPSSYRTFLATGPEGLHHYGYFSANYEADLARAEASGYAIEQHGKIGDPAQPEAAFRFTYYQSAGHRGTISEIIEFTEPTKQLYAMIEAAATGWDGSDPVRRLDG